MRIRLVLSSCLLLAMTVVETRDSVRKSVFASSESHYGNLTLSFEVNSGQADSQVKYLGRGPGYTVHLTPSGAVLNLSRPQADRRSSDSRVMRMKFVAANPSAGIVGLQELPGKVNYFIGSDPSRWRTNISTYARIRYTGVYPGIDVEYYGQQGQLEYDFVVAPGADPNAIRFEFEGDDSLAVDARGDLVLQGANDEIRLLRPVIYQRHRGIQREVRGQYALLDEHQVGFQIGPYDPQKPLVIDPILSYSAYLKGSDYDFGSAIAVDRAGNAYVSGTTFSTDFPTMNPLQPMHDRGCFYGTGQPCPDVFVAKVNTAGTALVYSTYLGGNDVDDGLGIVVDSTGNAYVTGRTCSDNFPLANSLQSTRAGRSLPDYRGCGDAFITKLNATGSALIYSTYLGGNGNDRASGIAVDSAGNAYVAGRTCSTNFPIVNPLQAAFAGPSEYCDEISWSSPYGDAFVTKLNASGTAAIYSTYLGGRGGDGIQGIAIDATGNAYVTGQTCSEDFPTASPMRPAYSGGYYGCGDAFVTKLNVAGSALLYSTYLGGTGRDVGNGIAVDNDGNAYVAGQTCSDDFPTANPFQTTYRRSCEAESVGFVTKLNSAGSALVYSTYLGGNVLTDYSVSDHASAIAVDGAANAYVTGITYGSDFPTANPLQPKYGGAGNAVVAKLNAAGSLTYSTYIGFSTFGSGIAVDGAGNAYVTGGIGDFNFPTANPVHGFVAKIADAPDRVGFVIPDRGGASWTTPGGSGTAVAGYGRIETRAGDAPPAAFAILASRQNDVLVSETAVPASPGMLSGQIYAEINGRVNTGLAIVNPNDQPAAVSFYFAGASGESSNGSMTIPANGQIAKFLNESPFNGPSPLNGSFTFTSSFPIAVSAFRGFTNERGEFLVTALPVVDLRPPFYPGTIILPHFADGSGWTTEVILVNTSDSIRTGTVQFLDSSGQPATVTANGQSNTSFVYSIPARSSQKFQTSGTAAAILNGSVRVVPAINVSANNLFGISALAVFSFRNKGITVSETSVPGGLTGVAFRLYAEVSGSIQTGVAVANPSNNEAVVLLELSRLDGSSTGLVGSLSIPANGHKAVFLNEVKGFDCLPRCFGILSVSQGVLRLLSATPIAVTGVRGRYNERNDFLITMTTPVNELAVTPAQPLFFPHILDSGGYASQFFLFGGRPGQASSGTIRLFNQSGGILGITLR